MNPFTKMYKPRKPDIIQLQAEAEASAFYKSLGIDDKKNVIQAIPLDLDLTLREFKDLLQQGKIFHESLGSNIAETGCFHRKQRNCFLDNLIDNKVELYYKIRIGDKSG